MDIYRQLIKQIYRTYANNKSLKRYLVTTYKLNAKNNKNTSI